MGRDNFNVEVEDMKAYDNWVNRLLEIENESKAEGSPTTTTKEGKTSNGIPFDLYTYNCRFGEFSRMSLKFTDCVKPEMDSTVYIQYEAMGEMNLYHTLNYIMHCEANTDLGQQRYKKYDTSFTVAKCLSEELLRKGYCSYRVDIRDKWESKVTVYVRPYKVSIKFDLWEKKVTLEFIPNTKHEIHITYPMNMVVSYWKIIRALEKDYYGNLPESYDAIGEEE